MREALAALIEAYGFAVGAFASGADILRAQAVEPAQCLVIDNQMPVMRGIDVLQTLRKRGDNASVILITGEPDRAVHARARLLRAVAILQKPVSHARLMAAVHQAMASGKQ